MKAECEFLEGGKYVDLSWLTLENATTSSMLERTLCCWVLNLAIKNYLIHSCIVENVPIFAQSDGGQKGQEVRLISVWNKERTTINQPDGECELYRLDLAYTGKKLEDVAKGIKHSLKKLGQNNTKLWGSTSNSGAGTPESWSNALDKEGLWEDISMEDLCGIHDLQSVFRLASQHFIGKGSLDKRNAIQLLHTMFSLYNELNRFKGRYKDIVRVLWKQTYESEMPDDLFTSVDPPKNLMQAMQEPLITQWWTIGTLAALASKYLKFFKIMAQAVVNMTKLDKQENTIAFSCFFALDCC